MDDRKRTLADGSPVTDDYLDIDPRTGQQKDYVVLAEEERQKGFQRPVRRSYVHVGKNPEMDGIVLIRPDEGACGTRTVMALSIAETYARDPDFYGGTFCACCRMHFPVDEFVWEGTCERVGS